MKIVDSRTKNDINMKLGSVSNLEKRKKLQLQCHAHPPCRVFPTGGMGESPFTCRKFAHPHSLNLYSSLPKVPTKTKIFMLHPNKSFIFSSFFQLHCCCTILILILSSLYTQVMLLFILRGSIFTCFF